MLFSSMIFLWAFLPAALLGSRILPRRLVNPFLTVASLFFYAWGEPVYVLVMMASIVINYASGMMLGQAKDSRARKGVLFLSAAANLLLLFCFKYLGLFMETLNAAVFAIKGYRSVFPVPQIALPIGISFFTFQGLSYVVDVYRGQVEPQRKLSHLALYISFFPQLIAGPIVRYHDISEQIEHRSVTAQSFAGGCRRFIYGLAKKVLVSNVMAAQVDMLYGLDIAAQMDGLMAWSAALMYALQIYYDFSGYSDMAIGLGHMFGFTFEENFRYPYLSRSIREFWRRWHISLSTWFREYVYIPLGGNRKGTARTYLNLLAVFFLTGVWHGAGYGFILWGLYHGAFSILERLFLGKWLKKHSVIAHAYTLLVVIFGWVLFRVEDISLALCAMGRMLTPWRCGVMMPVHEYINAHTAFVFVCAVLGSGAVQRLLGHFRLDERLRFSLAETAYLALLLLLCIASLASSTYNPFIYFKF